MKSVKYAVVRSNVDHLREQFRRRQLDKFFEFDGGRVIYALDNDIITLITAPWRTDNQRFLSDFFDVKSEAARSLAYLFANYFLSGEGNNRYVIIPPAENELEGMWNYVYEMALREKIQLDAGFEKLFDSIGRRGSNIPERELFDLVYRVLNSVHGTGGPLTELSRISTLLESGAVCRMDAYVDVDGVSPFPPSASYPHKDIIDEQNTWLRELNRLRSAGQKSHLAGSDASNNLIDASVMARLHWINKGYKENGIPVRLCFVTSATSLEHIGMQRDFFGESFSRSFLRNPNCFLGEPSFFARAGVNAPDFLGYTGEGHFNRATSIEDWLNVTFPKSGTSKLQFGTRKEEVEVLATIRDAEEQWSRYLVSVASAARIADSEFTEAINTYVRGISHLHVHQIRERFEVLRSRLGEIATDAFSRFGGSSALAGFWSLDPDRVSIKRGIPAVKFDSLREAKNLARELITTQTFLKLQHQMNRGWLNELRLEDNTGYSTFVIFALAFALAGQWATAFTVAKAAVGVATRTRERDPTSRVKGDEAAYLCAVFVRLCARSISDLDECEYWLAEAERRQKMEPIRLSIKERYIDVGMYEDPRFAAERLAIHITERWFAKFGEDGGHPMMEQLSTVKYPILRECQELLGVFRGVDNEPLEYVRRYVKEQVAVNFLQLQMLAKIEESNEDLLEEEVGDILEYLGKQCGRNGLGGENAHDELFCRSKLVGFLYMCGIAIFNSGNARFVNAAARKDFLKSLDDYGASLQLMPYDEARVMFFVRNARIALDKAFRN
ncbi:hypothetical protein THIOKS11320072 [Thiocapsa sp. KS1]|nr:hypothetical protein [Thiocapsa sp. KS1]CRI63423.1 hypothetical protein THIOKS11320072 [Thiocapsa sp. KS1]